ncbi:unnamed protein product [Staurois parvus]|nr:unnamed protein product [Staurois parvus]
MKRKRTL